MERNDIDNVAETAGLDAADVLAVQHHGDLLREGERIFVRDSGRMIVTKSATVVTDPGDANPVRVL